MHDVERQKDKRTGKKNRIVVEEGHIKFPFTCDLKIGYCYLLKKN